MKMFAKVFVAILAAVLASSSALQAPASLRLYVFDCGNLKSGNPDVLLARGVKVTDMSVAAYLIVHPQGTLLWDTGVIPDDLIKPDGTTEARATVKKTLKGQLAEIGYKSSDITYLALSHNHYDHSANANSFAGSTWLVQRQERDVMFPDTPPATPNAAAQRFSALQYGKTIVLDGDHDVFGDGSVIIISTPGHTPGHQSLFVNLNKTGPIILSGDLYHYPAERTLKDFTPFAALGNPEQEKRSKIKVEAWLQEKNATLWIQHDLIAWATLKKSPAYYE
jgi:glyoxylase-like metal-dependent hydrolase (beta-lactamase superfamily II)